MTVIQPPRKCDPIMFTEREYKLIEQYAKSCGPYTVSDVTRTAILNHIEGCIDVDFASHAIKEMKREGKVYSHESIGKELGFL